jgi:hypothetical protein
MRTGRAWTTVALLLVLAGLVAMATPAQAGEHPRKVWYLSVGDLAVGGRPARRTGYQSPDRETATPTSSTRS